MKRIHRQRKAERSWIGKKVIICGGGIRWSGRAESVAVYGDRTFVRVATSLGTFSFPEAALELWRNV